MKPYIKNPFIKVYTIGDLSVEAFATTSQKNKQSVRFLIVDDNLFEYKDEMRDCDFNIKAVKDLELLEAANEFDVIICDVHGVGKARSYENEGLGLLADLKRKYPYKLYAVYSGQDFGLEKVNNLDGVDILPKTLDIEDWKEILSGYVEKFLNPKTIWYIMRKQLLKANVPIITVAEIEHRYVDAIKNKNGDFRDLLKDSGLGLPQDVKSLLIGLTANGITSAVGL